MDIQNCNFAVVLLGCEAWFLTVWGRTYANSCRKLGAEESIGRKRDEVTRQ